MGVPAKMDCSYWEDANACRRKLDNISDPFAVAVIKGSEIFVDIYALLSAVA